jgi:hypothetical protein
MQGGAAGVAAPFFFVITSACVAGNSRRLSIAASFDHAGATIPPPIE